jgi:hypothetical protein
MASGRLSRRSFLSNTARATGGVITLGVLTGGHAARAQEAEEGYTFQNLTPQEGKTVMALAERIFPKDANGPGATDARAYVYIDRALGAHHADDREGYQQGLAALDRYCQAVKTKRFADLTPDEQNQVLMALDKRDAPPEWPKDGGIDSLGFLRMVITHTMEGMFADPMYGGNYDKTGWKLIKFPGRAPFGYDPPFGHYDMTIPEIQYPAFKPYSGPMKSRKIGEPETNTKKKR